MGIVHMGKPMENFSRRKKVSFDPRAQGKQLEAEVPRSLKDVGFLHRLYDTQDWQNATGSDLIVTGKQPADFIYIYRGHTFYLECKSCRNPMYVPLKNFKDHQMTMGVRIIQEGRGNIHHLHLISFRPLRRAPKAYLVRTDWLAKEYFRAIPLGLKGIYWNTIQKAGIIVGRDQGSKWDLLPALLMFTPLDVAVAASLAEVESIN